MAITNGYCALSELKAYIGITDSNDDNQLEDAVNSASRQIDSYCRRRFFVDGGASSRKYIAKDIFNLYTDDFSNNDPTVKIDTNDDGTFDLTLAAADFQLHPLNGLANGIEGLPFNKIVLMDTASDTFPTHDRRARVQVTATWGFAAVPEPIRQATLALSSELFTMATTPLGVAGVSEFGVVMLRENRKITTMIKDYRRGDGFGVA
tara:strand:- start:393 stop:1010 length:618 start_codon:yes stop_codon:yes gene_type:complete